jgi:hypothetical protein
MMLAVRTEDGVRPLSLVKRIGADRYEVMSNYGKTNLRSISGKDESESSDEGVDMEYRNG